MKKCLFYACVLVLSTELYAHQSNFDGFMAAYKQVEEPSEITRIAFEKFEDDDSFQESSLLRSALDIGAGTGRDSLFLLRKGWSVTATDSGEDAIRTMEAKVPKLYNSTFDLRKVPFENMSFPRSFDLVISNWAIDYTSPENYPRVFNMVTSLVKKGGRLAITFFGDAHQAIGSGFDHTLHSRKEVLAMLEDEFEIEYFNESKGLISGQLQKLIYHRFDIVAKKKHKSKENLCPNF